MNRVTISSLNAPNYRPRGAVEAWFNDGAAFDEWPDWVRSHYVNRGERPTAHTGEYAVRDDEGYFWRWFRAADFNERYERITP